MGGTLQSSESTIKLKLHCQESWVVQDAVRAKNANRHYSDPDAIDDQVIFNKNLPDQDRTTHTDNVGHIDFNEPEALDTEHGLIYYEHGQVQVEPRLSNPIPEIMYNKTTPQTERENHIPDENEQTANDVSSPTSPTETSEPTTRSNATRYSLREAPAPKTYDNFLVHELQAKQALLKFMRRKSADYE